MDDDTASFNNDDTASFNNEDIKSYFPGSIVNMGKNDYSSLIKEVVFIIVENHGLRVTWYQLGNQNLEKIVPRLEIFQDSISFFIEKTSYLFQIMYAIRDSKNLKEFYDKLESEGFVFKIPQK